MSFWTGSPDQFQQLSTKSPEQQSLMQRYAQMLQGAQAPQFLGQSPTYQSGMNYLQNLYGQSPDAFEKFKAPYMRQFQQETVPGLAERFASMGSGGNLQSGGFNQALARASEGLSTTLASQMEQLKAQMIPQLMSFAQAPMDQYQSGLQGLLGQNMFENVYQPGTTGFLGNLGSGLATGAGYALGGPIGGAIGSGLGGMMQDLMKPKAPIVPGMTGAMARQQSTGTARHGRGG